MENLEVSMSPDGVPLAFRVAGESWRVAEEPVRWYERTAWWERESRMPRESGGIDGSPRRAWNTARAGPPETAATAAHSRW
ncbi:hypothetical protein [Arthrobacter sp. SO3]|uniref:hypothetical protein n=1 Tax=Arthrobacter sp. SO3 TaxID=1897057 RepID=UPI001CFFF944|nr:hypothetical protein [Arthrobacter sp. SO3]